MYQSIQNWRKSSLLVSQMRFMFSASALAQNQTVTGTVVDELGEPVIGATVTVEGTKIATVTDLDGNYKISAPAGAKVTISYIGYMPQTQTVFVSGEKDQEIIEYNLQGQLTGRKLNIPEVFKNIYSNGGFEALTYQAQTHRFWTTSEFTLKVDGQQPTIESKIANHLRLQSFGDDLKPKEQYWYETDSTAIKKKKGRSILGVSGLSALDDGRIVVLEREMYFPKKQIGSYCLVKLYMVNPAQQQPGEMLNKTLLTEFRTKMNLTRRNFANYEGICVGPKLADGRQLLVLICDSQDQYRGVMKDWFKTVILP